jgi:hypothetical protein
MVLESAIILIEISKCIRASPPLAWILDTGGSGTMDKACSKIMIPELACMYCDESDRSTLQTWLAVAS